MTYGDKIRSMNDNELAEFLSACVIPDEGNEAMYISGVGRFMWTDDLADELSQQIKGDLK